MSQQPVFDFSPGALDRIERWRRTTTSVLNSPLPWLENESPPNELLNISTVQSGQESGPLSPFWTHSPFLTTESNYSDPSFNLIDLKDDVQSVDAILDNLGLQQYKALFEKEEVIVRIFYSSTFTLNR